MYYCKIFRSYHEMSDDDDMYRQRRKLYAQANMLVTKFYVFGSGKDKPF